MDEMQAEALTLPAPAPAQAADDARRRAPDRAERRLAARLRAGDADALAAAYDAYGAATFGLLVGMLGDRAAAEDVQQQVFTEVWRRAGDYDPRRAGLLTWVLTIARSRAIDHLRRRVPEPRDPQLPDPRTVEAEGDALLERWRVAQLFGRLPRDERALLRLRFYDGRSQSEISAATGIPIGTIKARMVRGLTRLREMIEAEGA
jgi:RNA polymerase sigma-70 factor (ECF subfamily)